MNHIFCYLVTFEGDENVTHGYVVGDHLHRGVGIKACQGATGLLAEQVRDRYPGKVIVDLLVQYAVVQPGQEGPHRAQPVVRSGSTPRRRTIFDSPGPEAPDEWYAADFITKVLDPYIVGSAFRAFV